MASLSDLPDDIIILISKACDVPGKACLARSNRHLNNLVTPVLLRYSVQEEDNSAMYWAAEHGHINTLDRMRSLGAELNDSTGSQLPVVFKRVIPDSSPLEAPFIPSLSFLPLHIAAKYGQDAAVEWLLIHGARIETSAVSLCRCPASRLEFNGRDWEEWEWRRNRPFRPSFWTPLHLAICNGNVSTAKLLISRGAALRAPRDPEGFFDTSDMIHTAAYHNNTELIEFLVGSGLVGVDEPDSGGNVALHYACSKLDNIQAVNKLVELGASLDIGTENSLNTPANLACKRGFFQAALVLLDKGAHLDLTPTDRLWYTVTRLCLNTTWDPSDPLPAMGEANSTWEGHREDFIRRLAQLGVDFNERLRTGTPLTLLGAERRSLARTLQAFLDVGADANRADTQGRTAICFVLDGNFDHLAASKAQLLLRYGARLDIHKANGPCAFDIALKTYRSTGDASVIEFIFQHASVANFGDGYLDRVVANSYGCHFFNECRLLVRHGAALKVVDEKLYADIGSAIDEMDLEQMNFHLDLFPNQIKPYEMLEMALKYYEDAKEDELEIVRSLLARPEIDSAEPCVPSRLLLVACKFHLKVAVAQLLLEKGGDLNCFDSTWESPLSYAVDIGCHPMVKYLLLHGADPHLAPSDQDWSAHVRKSPPGDYPEHLALGDNRYRTPFMRAIDSLGRHADTHRFCGPDAGEGAPRPLEIMLEHMPPPPIPQDPDCLSYIHYALAWPESLRILLEKGVDPNSGDHCARPPLLHCLAIADSMRPARPEALGILLEFGADIHRMDGEGNSFLAMMGKSTLAMANKALGDAELELKELSS